MCRAWTAEVIALNVEIETNRARLDAKYTPFAEAMRVADAIESSLVRAGSLPHIHRCLGRINRECFLSLKTLRAIRKEPAASLDDFARTNVRPQRADHQRVKVPPQELSV